MAFEERTKLAEIEILDTGRIQFREETQIFKDGVPIGQPEFHRSGVDVGYLDEADNLILFQLPSPPITKGLITDINLPALLTAVRTPEIQAKWKTKLLKDKADAEAIAERNRKDSEFAAEIERLAKEKEDKIRAELKAEQDREFDARVAEALKRSQSQTVDAP